MVGRAAACRCLPDSSSPDLVHGGTLCESRAQRRADLASCSRVESEEHVVGAGRRWLRGGGDRRKVVLSHGIAVALLCISVFQCARGEVEVGGRLQSLFHTPFRPEDSRHFQVRSVQHVFSGNAAGTSNTCALLSIHGSIDDTVALEQIEKSSTFTPSPEKRFDLSYADGSELKGFDAQDVVTVCLLASVSSVSRFYLSLTCSLPHSQLTCDPPPSRPFLAPERELPIHSASSQPRPSCSLRAMRGSIPSSDSLLPSCSSETFTEWRRSGSFSSATAPTSTASTASWGSGCPSQVASAICPRAHCAVLLTDNASAAAGTEGKQLPRPILWVLTDKDDR